MIPSTPKKAEDSESSDMTSESNSDDSSDDVSQKKSKKFFGKKLFSRDQDQLDNIQNIEDETISEEELWESVGLHKALGGSFFRNFVFMLVGAIIGVVTLTFVLQQLMPYPTSKGYYDITHGLFGFVWLIFDIGTAYGIERFIAEYMIKDKRKMFRYIQFFIWYQAITGLIQVTFISMWVLQTVPNGDMAYLAWLMLIINIKQYPGMLGTFYSVLKGMQAYDKSIIVSFIGGQGFEFLTQIVFIIGFRYWGMANPAIGEMLGLSIGLVLGFYIDDFFSMGLAMYFFGKVAKQYGFTAKEAWRHDFDWELVKECLRFGLALSWVSLIGSGIGLITLTISMNEIPGYATWVTLAALGSGLASSMNMGGDVDLNSVLSESINNGKKELSSFYLEQSFKYWAFIMFAMAGIITVLIPVITKVIFLLPDVANQYEYALVFIIPGIFSMIWDVPIRQMERMIVMSGHVWFKSFIELFIFFFNLAVWAIMVLYLHIWEWGIIGIIILFVLGSIPSKIIRLIIYTVYVQKKIVKIRISWYQTFGASIITFIGVYFLGSLFVYGIFMPTLDLMIGWFGVQLGTIITGVMGALVIIIGFMIIVFPLLYALAGGWDEFGLETLRKSYLLSGPSKPFIKIIYRLSVIGSRISPLYNKYKMDWTKAFEEAKELLVLKKADTARIKAENALLNQE
jgi:hypothetical protein